MNLKAIKTKAIAAFMVLLMAFFVANFVFAADTDYLDPTNNGLDTAAGNMFDKDGEYQTVEQRISLVVQTALSLLGVVFMVLMLYGGFLWMTARGDEGQITKSKDLITAAIIGVVIVMGAYAITYFVVSKASTGTLQ